MNRKNDTWSSIMSKCMYKLTQTNFWQNSFDYVTTDTTLSIDRNSYASFKNN